MTRQMALVLLYRSTMLPFRSLISGLPYGLKGYDEIKFWPHGICLCYALRVGAVLLVEQSSGRLGYVTLHGGHTARGSALYRTKVTELWNTTPPPYPIIHTLFSKARPSQRHNHALHVDCGPPSLHLCFHSLHGPRVHQSRSAKA